jgi:hypothetical protein
MVWPAHVARRIDAREMHGAHGENFSPGRPVRRHPEFLISAPCAVGFPKRADRHSIISLTKQLAYILGGPLRKHSPRSMISLTLVSDYPELTLACRSERASLLYHRRFVKAVVKEERELSRTSGQRDKRKSCRPIFAPATVESGGVLDGVQSGGLVLRKRDSINSNASFFPCRSINLSKTNSRRAFMTTTSSL